MELKEATVLIVDDEPMLCDIFKRWLEVQGCRVLTAENGAAALRVLDAERVDVVTTDIRMPVMDGLAFVKILHSREWEAGQYTPKVVFITGFADVEPRDAYDLGVEALMQKPIDRKTFLETISRTLQSREEIWSQPVAEAGMPLRMNLPPVSTAVELGAIEFGRGGFCIRSEDLPLSLGPVRFELKFESEPLVLTGHGLIRWLDSGEHQAGIEILNFDDECRGWAIRRIGSVSSLSHIPRTCRQSSGAVRAGG